MYKIYCRIYQEIFRIAAYFMPWRKPELLTGSNSVLKLPQVIQKIGINKVMIITDQGIFSIGLMDSFLDQLKKTGIEYVIYSDTVPNPTIENVEEARVLYVKSGCQGLVAFGGGSSIDCAKGVGARLARPKKTLSQMRGQLKIRKKIPTLFAVPTTSGTGSEATLAAVIADSKTHEKYALNDMSLIPHFGVLDPQLTIGLPPHITSTTGMDALTHAVEAYIGRSNTRQTRELAKKSVKLIFENLYQAYSQGEDVEARRKMQKASLFAGMAFTRAYIGYVHAIAHTLGGFYGTPHGLANAVILPHVLEYYGKSVHKQLAELAVEAGISNKNDSIESSAQALIREIKSLNTKMGHPDVLGEIRKEDIPLMVHRALKESNPLYPVPVIFGKKDMYALYNRIRK